MTFDLPRRSAGHAINVGNATTQPGRRTKGKNAFVSGFDPSSQMKTKRLAVSSCSQFFKSPVWHAGLVLAMAVTLARADGLDHWRWRNPLPAGNSIRGAM